MTSNNLNRFYDIYNDSYNLNEILHIYNDT